MEVARDALVHHIPELIRELQAVETLLARWAETLQTDAAHPSEPTKTMEATRDALFHHVPELIRELQAVETVLARWAETLQTDDDARSSEPAKTLEAARGALVRHVPELIRDLLKLADIHPILDEAIRVIAPDGNGMLRQKAQAAFAILPSPAEATAREEPSPATRAALVYSASLDSKRRNHSDNSTPRADEEIEQRYIVRHSGVVLLAPFFTKFFDACGLLHDSDWQDKAAQYQAVQLLNYLCAGSKKTPEYSLVLEKLCCGIAIEEPIPLETGLQQHQLDEAQTLLGSVIQHWKILKNTSVDGLRETFLKRDGLITKKQDGWLLRVERKTLDVLLDSIPWGYSTITLPWNDYLIHVEW